MSRYVEKIDESILEYKGLRVGDMCTSYFKGYYVVLGFAPYGNGRQHLGYTVGGSMQCIHKRVADSTGQPCGGQPKSCAAEYCKKFDYQRLTDDREYETECLRLKYNALHGIQMRLEDEQLAANKAR